MPRRNTLQLMAKPINVRERADERADLPIACALAPTAGAERLMRWRALLEMAPSEVERGPNQIRIRVAHAPGVAAELDALVAAERACCSFVEWDVERDGDWCQLRIHGSAEGLDAIAAIFRSD